MFQTIALVVHVFLAIGVIGLVLMQHGKGAEAGAAFGAGASATVFGSRGSGSFLTRMTTLFALAFFCTSMVLFFIAANQNRSDIGSVVDGIDVPAVEGEDMPSHGGDMGGEGTGGADVPAVPNSESSTESDVPAAPKSE